MALHLYIGSSGKIITKSSARQCGGPHPAYRARPHVGHRGTGSWYLCEEASKVLVADSVNEYFAFGEGLKMGFGVSQVHKGRERRGKGQGQVYQGMSSKENIRGFGLPRTLGSNKNIST